MSKKRTQLRLLAVVVLLLIPIGLLGWLFVQQSNKDIAFARKEVAGVDYLAAVMPVLSALTLSDGVPDEASLAALAEAAALHDETMASGEYSAKLLAALARGPAHRETAAAATRDLITRIGDQSNLILDPDLDSYYLMDVLLLRVPEILSTSDATRRVLGMVDAGATPGPTARSAIMLENGRLAAARTGLTQSFRAAFTSNPDGGVRRALAGPALDYGSKLSMFIASVQSIDFAAEGTSVALFAGASEIDAAQASLNRDTVELWKRTAGELRRLLEARIDGFQHRLRLALGTAVTVALAALLIAVGVFRQMLTSLDDRILFLAHRDVLTSLHNRSAITEEIENALARARRSGIPVAVHLIDLDRFKSINDTIGHHAGDDIIRAMGERLSRVVGTEGVIGRLGGDEFVIVQPDVSDLARPVDLGSRVCMAMREPFTIGGRVLNASASVGTALFPSHASDETGLMKCADMALYKAKAGGRDRAIIFTDAFAAEAIERARIEEAVRVATETEGFTLAFQPQYDPTGRILKGFEALLRLEDEAGRSVSPAVFIPIAEHLNLIGTIGAWVIGRACGVATRWPTPLTVAVNLSPEQFREPGISEVVAAALEASGLDPARLEVEITEGTLLENSEAVMAELAAIRALGVSIAMDDFGTGYSSLSYLLRFPFDKIKIDRSFMLAVERGEANARNVLETIVALGHRLSMRVTAEGVETAAQARILTDMHCDEIQGYLYGRPMPEIDVASLILNNWRGALQKPVLERERRDVA